MTKIRIMTASVRGYAHKIKNMPCQDAWKRKHVDDGCEIIAVADGHGNVKAHPFSEKGAGFAVEIFCRIISNYTMELGKGRHLQCFLENQGNLLAKEIEVEWKKAVIRYHQKTYPESLLETDLVKLYGTTLMGILITDTFIFSFQIGDGDMLLVYPERVMSLAESEWLPGGETKSLCEKNSYQNAVMQIKERKSAAEAQMYWLSTDGFLNSFATDQEFEETAMEYLHYIQTYGFSKLRSCLKEYLEMTSVEGSGDDITLAIAYIGEAGDDPP